MASATTADVLLILISILFPPAAAAILTGCSCALFVNILLTLLGYIPGHLHAFWLIYKKIQADERYGPSGSTYISQGVYQPIGGPVPSGHQGHPHQQGYHAGPSNEVYAGQGAAERGQAPQDPPKGPPPAYGTM